MEGERETKGRRLIPSLLKTGTTYSASSAYYVKTLKVLFNPMAFVSFSFFPFSY